jgi:NAD(P)H-dependent FMN reductase
MITVIVGTNRPDRNTRKVARHVEEIYADLKVPLHVLDLAAIRTLNAPTATGIQAAV